MADYGFDGMIKVSWVPTIANIAAPTVAELNAGIELECHLTPDGLSTPAETGEIDNSKLCSTSNSAIVGRRNYSGLSVKYVRGDDEDAVAVEEALIYKASGFLTVRRDMSAEVAYAPGQRVEIYPAQAKEPNPDAPAADALQTVEVGFANTKDPRGYSNPATVAGA